MRKLAEIYSSLTESPSGETVKRIQDRIIRAGGKPYIVGGAVRDEMLPDTPASKDVDFLITGMELKKIAQVLKSLGQVKEVGKAFGVVKAVIDGEEFDFAIPRTGERKTGSGHADFEVDLDPHASPESDLSRRDFTFNALAKDPSGRILDLFGGQEDIHKRLVRAVGNPVERFTEDPLRMLRAIQFAVRFDFDIEPETSKAIQRLSNKLSTVAPERVAEEFSKGWKKGKNIQKFVELLSDLKVGEALFGPDFDPIPAEIHGSSEDETVLKGFISFFLHGGDIKKFKPTNEQKRYLDIARGAVSGRQTWQFANELDRNKIPLVVKTLEAIDKSNFQSRQGRTGDVKEAAKRLKDALKLPLGAKELKISGQDFMKMGIKGREIGLAQKKLLAAVHNGDVRNEPQDIEMFLQSGVKSESLSLMNVLTEATRYRIYCDMDGVLVNFMDGLTEYLIDYFENLTDDMLQKMSDKQYRFIQEAAADYGLTPDDIWHYKQIPKVTPADLEKTSNKKGLRKLSYWLIEKDDLDFWVNLDWMQDGKILWDYIENYRPTILSAPVGEARGKIYWCKMNLHVPQSRIVLSHDKFEYASPNSILIDDTKSKIDPFVARGGIGILHKSAAETIRKLKELGL